MKKVFVGMMAFGGLWAGVVFGEVRERELFNDGWVFSKGDPADAGGAFAYERMKAWVLPTGDELLAEKVDRRRPEGNPGRFHNGDISYLKGDFSGGEWRSVELPHDWGVEGDFVQELSGDTGKLPFFGVAWYRKEFEVAKGDEGKRVFLELDGAMSYGAVWINGKMVGGWPYGYTSWRVELTGALKFGGGKNVLLVRLDNPKESSRWYPGGGIYRNVWLSKTGRVAVGQWGLEVRTPVVEKERAMAEIGVRVENTTGKQVKAGVVTKVFAADGEGKIVGGALAESESAELVVPAGQDGYISRGVEVLKPKLWGVESPVLHVAVAEVRVDGKLVDRVETTFGFRTIEMNAERGLILNGEAVRVNGACMHHDLGALGAAFNWRAAERQLEILKEMGCNAIRTSHNMPAPELLDLCDRMGFLVMVETFDCWALGKKRDDYSRVFADWHEKDLRAVVRRDRNHPCVIWWSIGNEVREQGMAEGWKVGAMLAEIVKGEDATRFVTMGFSSVRAPYFGFQRAVDVVGFNYKPFEYVKYKATYPWKPQFGAETASTISSRGEYFFPVSEDKSQGQSNFQMSSYDLYAPRWASTPDDEWRGMDAAGVTGEFVWTGFDYLGEPTPYNNDATNLLNFTDEKEKARMQEELDKLGKLKVPSRSSYFGIVDLAGFRKDRFYFYQTRWLPELKMAHILPHWNWPERVGEVVPVHVYSSGDEAELFLNGKSLGKRVRGKGEYRFRWDDVKYAAGELKVVVKKEGKAWAEAVRRTTEEAVGLKLEADRKAMCGDGKDLIFVTVSVVDGRGELVPRSKNLVKFSVEGPAEIAAVDNGDATELEGFWRKERKAYNGMVLVILKGKKGEVGEVVLKAESGKLKGTECRVKVEK